MKIDVCLSGRGFCASSYALDVLTYLAETSLLAVVVGVSAVSGSQSLSRDLPCNVLAHTSRGMSGARPKQELRK